MIIYRLQVSHYSKQTLKSRSVIVKMMDCELEVSEIELQSC